MLEELLGGPSKEPWKKKRDNGKAKVEKGDATVGEEALASLGGGVIDVVLEVPTTDPEVGVPIEETEVVLPTLMEIEMVEVALAVALPALSTSA